MVARLQRTRVPAHFTTAEVRGSDAEGDVPHSLSQHDEAALLSL